MTSATATKLSLPGWRIEPRYNNHVLIGNWNEECRNFRHGKSNYISTNRADFKNYGNVKPDTKIRRACFIRNDGIGKKYIFNHHDQHYKGNHITWYDQHYNKRELNESKLPALRKWDGKSLAYFPEKSDFPLQGKPRNYGLNETLMKKWKEQELLESIGQFATTYKISFSTEQPVVMNTGNKAVLKSTPRRWSSKLHPHQINKNLYLREMQYNTSPERCEPCSV